MLAPNSCKPIHSGARPRIKVPMPCHPFSKGNINNWYRRLRHEMWRFSESLDSMEILMTATFALKENSNTPSSQEGHSTLKKF